MGTFGGNGFGGRGATASGNPGQSGGYWDQDGNPITGDDRYSWGGQYSTSRGGYSSDSYGAQGSGGTVNSVWVEIERVVWDGEGDPPHTNGEVYTGDVVTPVRAYWKSSKEDYIAEIADPVQVSADLLIQGATQNTVRAYVQASNLPEGEYEVRVRRTTEPSQEISEVDTVYWSQMQEIIYDDFSYPGTALLGVQVEASDQISGGRPTVSVIVTRLEIADQIPYSGGWSAGYYEEVYGADGTPHGKFWKEVAWETDASKTIHSEGESYYSPYSVIDSLHWRYIESDITGRSRDADNPAWVAWDILTNEEYGAMVPHSQMNHDAFVKWSHWCNLRKLTCNIYFDQGVSVAEALRYVGNCGRAAVIMMGTTYTVLVDMPEDVSVQTFMLGEGSIIRDSFTEEYMPVTDRANSIEVTYYDRNLDYTRQMVEVYDEFYDEVEHLINKTSINLLGCTDREMAIAYARYCLLKNRLLTKTVTFRASTDAIGCVPGQVIDISSDVPLVKRSGRIFQAESWGAILDREVVMQRGKQYVLKVRYQDDTQAEIPLRNPNVEKPTSTVRFSTPLSRIPEQYSPYHFAESGRQDNFYRVLSITRADDQTRTISAIEYIPEIYLDRLPEEIGEIKGDVQAVSDVEATEVWALGKDGSGHSTISVTWDGFAYSWGVFLREHSLDNSLPWQKMGDATVREFTIDRDLTLGKVYDVGVSVFGPPTTEDTVTLTILGKLAPPSDVENFQAVAEEDLITFSWDHIPDIDLSHYEIRRGDTWESGLIIVDRESKNTATWRPPTTRAFRFWIKAVDTSGIYSRNASLFVLGYQQELPLNVILEHDEIHDNPEENYYFNMYPTEEGVYWLPSMTNTDADLGTKTNTSLGIIDYKGGRQEGFLITEDYDLGEEVPYTLRMDAEFEAIARNVTNMSYPFRTNMTFPLDTNLTVTSNSRCKIEYSTVPERAVWGEITNLTYPDRHNLNFPNDTNINVSYPLGYWKKWTEVGGEKSQKIRFRYSVVSESPSVFFHFTKCWNSLDVPDKESILYDQSIPVSGREYIMADLPVKYYQEYAVFATVTSFGAYIPSVEKTATGFTVQLYDITGNPTTGTVDLRIRGY